MSETSPRSASCPPPPYLLYNRCLASMPLPVCGMTRVYALARLDPLPRPSATTSPTPISFSSNDMEQDGGNSALSSTAPSNMTPLKATSLSPSSTLNVQTSPSSPAPGTTLSKTFAESLIQTLLSPVTKRFVPQTPTSPLSIQSPVVTGNSLSLSMPVSLDAMNVPEGEGIPKVVTEAENKPEEEGNVDEEEEFIVNYQQRRRSLWELRMLLEATSSRVVIPGRSRSHTGESSFNVTSNEISKGGVKKTQGLPEYYLCSPVVTPNTTPHSTIKLDQPMISPPLTTTTTAATGGGGGYRKERLKVFTMYPPSSPRNRRSWNSSSSGTVRSPQLGENDFLRGEEGGSWFPQRKRRPLSTADLDTSSHSHHNIRKTSKVEDVLMGKLSQLWDKDRKQRINRQSLTLQLENYWGLLGADESNLSLLEPYLEG